MTDMVLKVRFTADGAELVEVSREGSKELDKLADKERDVGRAGKEAGQGVDRFTTSAKNSNPAIQAMKRNIVALVASYVSLRKASDFVKDFRAQEQAVQKLDASIESMGRTTDGLSIKLQRLASQIQREGIIGDEALIEGQSFLTTYSQITDDLLPRSTRVMADLAAKMSGDIVSAANLVGKASMGMTGELSRVGITLSEAAKESKDFELILTEIESQVGGTNKAVAEGAGVFDQYGNRIGDAGEKIGELITMNRGVRAFSEFFVERIEAMTGALVEFNDAFLSPEERSAKLAKSFSANELFAQETQLQTEIDRKKRKFSDGNSFLQLLASPGFNAEQKALNEQLQAIRAARLKLDAAAQNNNQGGGASSGAVPPVDTKTIDSFQKLKEQLEKQIALHGQSSIAAETHYEIVKSGLDVSNAALAQQLEDLAKERDAQIAATKAADERKQKMVQIAAQVKRDSEELDKVIAARKQALRDRVDALDSTLATETELENRRHEQALQDLERAEEEQLDTILSYRELRERLENKHQDNLEDIRKRANAEQTRKEEAAARRRAELLQEPFKNAIRNVQNEFTNFFESVFRGGINSFGDLARGIKNIFIRLAAELATLQLFSFVSGGSGGSASAGGGGITSAARSLLTGGGSGGGGFSIPGLPGGGFSGLIDGFGAKLGFGPGSMGGLTTPANASALTNASLSSVLGAGALGFAGGGIFADLVGLNSKGGSIGGGIGAAIGMATPLGPLGALIGGGIGATIGGFFGGKPSDKTQGITLTNSGVTEFGLTGKKFDAELRQTVDGIGAELQTALNTIEDQIGATLSGKVQVKIGNRDRSRIVGGGETIFTEQGDTRAAFDAAMGLLVKQVKGGDEKLLSVLRSEFASSGDINQALSAVNNAKAVSDQINGLAGDNGPLAALNKQFEELRRNASKYGLSLTEVNSAYITSLNQLRDQQTASLQQVAQQASQLLNIDSFRQFRDQLSFSEFAPGNPVDRFNQAKSLLDSTARAALAGDIDAGNQFLPLAQQVLQLGRSTFASDDRFTSLFKEVNTTSGRIQAAREAQLSTFTDGVNISFDNSTTRQVEALGETRDDIVKALKDVENELAAERRRREEADAKQQAALDEIKQATPVVQAFDRAALVQQFANVSF